MGSRGQLCRYQEDHLAMLRIGAVLAPQLWKVLQCIVCKLPHPSVELLILIRLAVFLGLEIEQVLLQADIPLLTTLKCSSSAVSSCVSLGSHHPPVQMEVSIAGERMHCIWLLAHE